MSWCRAPRRWPAIAAPLLLVLIPLAAHAQLNVDITRGYVEPQPQPVEQATATEIDALRTLIRRQIEPCWNPPVGAQYAEDLVVSIRVWVDPDGTVRRAEIVNGGLMALDSFYEAAADSARRAVLNPRCNPLELPRDRYKLWRQMELTFNPQEMLGL